MGWKNQLTKTPYLVLFVVLISIGVGTASAAITITLAGNVHVLGEMKIDETLLIGTDNPNGDDGIRFDDGSEVLFWDESEDSFRVTDDLVTEGDLRTTGDLRVGTIDAEDNDKIFFDDGTETLMWQNTNAQFELSDGLLVNGDLITTTDIEGETFLVGPSNSGDNDFIFFDFISEHLMWDDTGNRFEFSNDLFVNGEVNCPTCILGFYHKTVDFDVEGSGLIGVQIPCDAEDTAIGGTFEALFDNDPFLIESRPAFDAWETTVRWSTTPGVGDFIRMGTMCADHPPVHVP